MVGEELLFNGTIDLNTCIQMVNGVSMDKYAPGAIITILLLGFALVLVFWAFDLREKKLMKDYLRRQSLLNKYEDWKKDRKLGDDN
jgi:hypothetical protein